MCIVGVGIQVKNERITGLLAGNCIGNHDKQNNPAKNMGE
jgi:hypothetical protein